MTTASSSASGSARDLLRSRIRPAVRRGLAKIGPLDRAVSRLRGSDEVAVGSNASHEQAAPTWTGETTKALHQFFDTMCGDGAIEDALVALTRRLLAAGDRRRARAMLQTLQRYPDLAPIADICLAVSAITEPMPDTAWTLFSRNDLALVVKHVPRDYFRFGFGWRPDATRESLSRVLANDVALETDEEGWYEIAFDAFAAGCDDVAAGALDRAEALVTGRASTPKLESLLRRIDSVRDWMGRPERAARMAPIPRGEVSLALIGYSHPSLPAVSNDIADPMQTLVVLGHLLRHEGVYAAGRPALGEAATDVAKLLRQDRRISHDKPRIVQLHVVERDASKYAEVPDGSWTIVSEWFTHPLAGRHYDIPMNPRLRPIFVGFHITVGQLHTPGAIEYLRKYAPIGCLDWDTVFLLHAAGVPAFFSGGITMTSDVLFEARSGAATSTVSVDMGSEGKGGDESEGEQRTHLDEKVRRRPLAANLIEAAGLLRDYRDGDAKVITRDLRTYLALRGLGVESELRSLNPERARISDHISLSDAEFKTLQTRTTDKIAAVIGAIVDARPEDEVYKVWQDACADDVAVTEQRLREPGDAPKLSFDLGKVCRTILERSVTVERTDSSAKGVEINVEFSLDANYKHQLDVVLDSVVAHTTRPVRAFVLCRGHDSADFQRMARLFPSVSFVWLPTDAVDYGRISDMNKWVTPATMDRTILPVLLPEVDRMIHFDLDALCLADLGELYDTDLEGAAIASTREPQPKFVSGFETYRWSANRLRREGSGELAREFTIRTHAEDRFDFDVFNAGIMVMDLAKMRADDFCGRYLPYVQHYGLNGQIVLNTYTGNTAKYVDPRWNQLVRIEVMDEPKIAHWAGPMKPWKQTLYVAGRELWDEGERRFAERSRRADLQ